MRVNSSGDIEMKYTHWSNGLLFSNTSFDGHSMINLRPQTNWYGSLGTYTRKFAAAYIDHIYYWLDTEYSDMRIKENIKTIDNSLEKILALQPVTYHFKNEFFHDLPDKIKTERKRSRYGFLAQDVKKIIPEIVYTEPESQLYTLDIEGIIPFLVDAVKQEHEIVEDLKKEVEILKQANNNTHATKSTQKSSSKDYMPENGAQLFQNTPNPFTQNTTIAMLIPEEVAKATLYVYDMQGTQKKSIPVISRGNTSVTISGGEFDAGMYMYTLIADGKEVDTKRMILTE